MNSLYKTIETLIDKLGIFYILFYIERRKKSTFEVNFISIS